MDALFIQTNVLPSHLLSSHGVNGTSSWQPATLTAAADVADAASLAMESGSGSECLTMAPYSPYSAMILQLERLHVFSVLRHLARRFWNQTFADQRRTFNYSVNVEGKAVASVRPSVGLSVCFHSYLLNRLTFELELFVCRRS